MATERQINANRANALKSTGPVTPEGKRISSKNGALPSLVSGTVVLKGESMRRFNELAAALALQFKPRNSAETFLIQTMTVARWRLLRMWGIQTAAFELEMARVRQKSGAAAESGAVLAAVTFRILADDSGALALQHRFEAAYDRQYNRALATLLKLRQAAIDSRESGMEASSEAPSLPAFPSLHLATETWGDGSPNAEDDTEPDAEHDTDVGDVADDFQSEPNFEANSEEGSQPS